MALSTTTLSAAVGSSDSTVTLVSTSAVTSVGLWLYVDREAMRVTALANSGGVVKVQRGVGGTSVLPHVTGLTVYIGTSDQFYQQDPEGTPPTWPPNLPWINLLTGTLWNVSGSAWIPVGGSSGGNMTGPASATSGAVALFDGTTGTLLKDSTVVLTVPASTSTLTLAAGKTFTVSKTLALTGTDSTTMTFPATSATIARTDAANTFTGVQTMTSPVLTTPAIGVATGTSVDLSGDCKAATFHVGATAGASGGPFTSISSITVVNGIITAITGT